LLGLRIISSRRAVQASNAKWNAARHGPANLASACRATVSSGASATSVTGIVVTISTVDVARSSDRCLKIGKYAPPFLGCLAERVCESCADAL
jgi:hypothetical protein